MLQSQCKVTVRRLIRSAQTIEVENQDDKFTFVGGFWTDPMHLVKPLAHGSLPGFNYSTSIRSPKMAYSAFSFVVVWPFWNVRQICGRKTLTCDVDVGWPSFQSVVRFCAKTSSGMSKFSNSAEGLCRCSYSADHISGRRSSKSVVYLHPARR